MTKWDYQVLTFTSWTGKLKDDHVAQIAQSGEEGWELAGLTTLSNSVIAIFKRPRDAPRQREERGWPQW